MYRGASRLLGRRAPLPRPAGRGMRRTRFQGHFQDNGMAHGMDNQAMRGFALLSVRPLTPPTRLFTSAPTRAFTLVEILIVVVLLAILAAMTIPQFAQASSDSRAAALMSDIQTMRRQIQLYRAEHGDAYPTIEIVAQMTQYSDAAGNTSATSDTAHPHGPYLTAFPKNPISGIATVHFVTDVRLRFIPSQTDAGWWYNAATGELRADLTNSHTLPSGLIMNQF